MNIFCRSWWSDSFAGRFKCQFRNCNFSFNFDVVCCIFMSTQIISINLIFITTFFLNYWLLNFFGNEIQATTLQFTYAIISYIDSCGKMSNLNCPFRIGTVYFSQSCTSYESTCALLCPGKFLYYDESRIGRKNIFYIIELTYWSIYPGC